MIIQKESAPAPNRRVFISSGISLRLNQYGNFAAAHLEDKRLTLAPKTEAAMMPMPTVDTSTKN
jgi:hypothetical protein